MPDGLAVFDGENRFVYWNAVLEKLTGLSSQAVLGQNLFSFFPGIKEKNQDFHVRETLAGRTSHSFQFPFGEILIPDRSFEIFYTPLRGDTGAVTGGLISARDVSVQAQESRLIQEREERLRQFFEIAEEAIMIHDQGVIQDVNPALARMLGYEPSEMIGRHVSQFSDAGSAKKTKTYMAVGYPEGTYEYIAKRKDGATFPIEIKGRDYETAGKTLRVSTGWDISYRKKIEQTIQESEERLRRFVEITREGILVHRRGRVLDANPSIQELLGYSAEELIGRDTTEFMDEASARKVREFRGGDYPAGPYEVVLRHKNGEIIPVEALGREIMWEGEPARFVSVWDIRGRKKAEEALKQSEVNFRSLIERSPQAILVHEGLKVLYANPALVSLLGYPNAQAVMDSRPLTHIPLEDQTKIQARIDRAQAGHQNPPLEMRIRCFDGSEKTVESVSLGLGFEGRPATMVILRDLTEEKKAQEKLRQKEEYYRALLENTHDMITVVGPDGKSLYLGPGIQKVLGYSAEERLGKNAFEFIHPEDLAWAREAFLKLAQTPAEELVPFTLRMLHKDGKWRRVAGVAQNLSAHPLVQGMLINYRDVTQQVAAEEARHQSEEKFRSLIENSHDVISVTERDGLMSYISPSVKHVLGYEPSERIGQGYIHIMHPEDMEHVKKEFSKLLQTQGVAWTLEFRLRHKDGSWKQVESTGINLLENPSVRGIVYNLRDVTEKKRAEDASRDRGERFRRFAEVTQEGILIHDKGTALDANQAFADMVGLPLSKIIGRNSFEFMDEESRERIEGYIQEGYPGSYEIRVKRKDGSTFPAEIRGRHFSWEGRDVRVISVFDITERQKTEEAMLKMERLSAIGEMAAGMAHEIRNPLSAISMAAQLLRRKSSAQSAAEEELYLKTILEQSARLEQLVKDTLDYARQEKDGEIPAISLKGALQSALRLSQIQIGPSEQKVKALWELSSEDLKARAHPQRIQQILINLILNAYQAMPDGGTLTLSLSAEAQEVVLKVADTGPGLAKKDMQRLFEPFFTTKGTGSGLGLAISQRIAVQYGGEISAEKLKPRGIAFTLRLPRAEGGAA